MKHTISQVDYDKNKDIIEKSCLAMYFAMLEIIDKKEKEFEQCDDCAHESLGRTMMKNETKNIDSEKMKCKETGGKLMAAKEISRAFPGVYPLIKTLIEKDED